MLKRFLFMVLGVLAVNIVFCGVLFAQSLWDDSSNLFADDVPNEVGDIITVVIDENVAINDSLKATSKKTSDASVSDGTGILDFIKGFGFKANNNYSGQDSVQRSRNYRATITVMVTEVLPNGNLVIEGEKKVSAGRESVVVALKGVIRPQDVDADNTIKSSLIANPEIVIRGKGISASVRKPGIITQILNFLF